MGLRSEKSIQVPTSDGEAVWLRLRILHQFSSIFGLSYRKRDA